VEPIVNNTIEEVIEEDIIAANRAKLAQKMTSKKKEKR